MTPTISKLVLNLANFTGIRFDVRGMREGHVQVYRGDTIMQFVPKQFRYSFDRKHSENRVSSAGMSFATGSLEHGIKLPRSFMLLQYYANLTSVCTGVFARQDFRDHLEVFAAHVNLGRTRQLTLSQVHLPE
jgi:hypothetical protein